jgi:ElaB/YqjD/DUF883 family membrane-anchored ribosome-binding protein
VAGYRDIAGLRPDRYGIVRGIMFHHRSSSFAPSVSAIQKHLGAVEKELERIGRLAGSRTSVAAVAAGDQISDAISTIMSDMVDRFRRGGATARDGATRLGNEAARLGTSYGNDAMQRVVTQVEDRPLITLGVALGVGILIGAVILGNISRSRS